MIFITNVIMPQFTEDVGERFMVDKFGQYLQDNNPSTLGVIWGMLTQPLLVLKELISPFGDTVEYFLGQWLSLGLIPALSPASWIITFFPSPYSFTWSRKIYFILKYSLCDDDYPRTILRNNFMVARTIFR